MTNSANCVNKLTLKFAESGFGKQLCILFYNVDNNDFFYIVNGIENLMTA